MEDIGELRARPPAAGAGHCRTMARTATDAEEASTGMLKHTGDDTAISSPHGASPVQPIGLGQEVDALVAKSPTLTAAIRDLRREGWTIRYGFANGSYTDLGFDSTRNTKSKEIILDGRKATDALGAVRSLAHEVGHARYGHEPYVSKARKTKKQWLQLNVDARLRGEGEAVLVNAQARREILDNDGPDISISGQYSEKYIEIYDRYARGELSRAEARSEIATRYADERRSVDGKRYRDYLTQYWNDHWDRWEKLRAGGS
ncbi:hypothetical protein [Nocardia testacea]|uniref:hypothetical protein n=1 Tax=Nocardia testacea TaxID=248551 RepID=UPI003A8BC007